MIASIMGLLLSSFFLFIAHGLINILIPITLNMQGVNTIQIGLVQSCYPLGGMVGYITSSFFIRRSSHIRTFCAAAAIFSLGAISLSLYFNVFLWALIRFGFGLAISTAATSIESWLLDVSNTKNRSQVLAVYMIVYTLAVSMGQLLSSMQFTLNLYIVANMLAIMAVLPLSLSRMSGPEYSSITSMKLRDALRDSPLGIIGCFFYGLTYGAIFSMGSIFALKIGLSVFQTSIFMFSVIIGGFVFQYPIGKISDMYDRRFILACVIIFSMATNLIVLNLLFFNPDFEVSKYLILIFLFASISGGSTSLIYPLCLAASFDWIKKENIVSATKLCLMSMAVGTILAPIFGSVFMEVIGPKGLLFYFLLTEGSLLTYVGYRKIVRKSLPVSKQSDFIVMPKTSASSALFLEDYAESNDSEPPDELNKS